MFSQFRRYRWCSDDAEECFEGEVYKTVAVRATAAYGRQRMGSSVWAAVYGQQRMGSSIWAAAYGQQRIDGSVVLFFWDGLTA